jgi:predicted flap endonuclease-1-like 5' DNA nuclease
MPGNFNPNKSRVTDDQMMAWLDKDVSGNLLEVPGIGDTSVEIMATCGITTTWQLFGKFLLVREADMTPLDHCDAFWDFLEDCETPPGYRSGVVAAIQEKLSSGMRLPISNTEIVTPTPGGYDPMKSTVKEDTLMQFLDRDLTDDITIIPGISEKSQEKLAAEDINTTFQLFGKFLMSKDEGASFQAMCDNFYKFLAEAKTSPGHRAGVIQCMSEKIAMGIKIPIPTEQEAGKERVGLRKSTEREAGKERVGLRKPTEKERQAEEEKQAEEERRKIQQDKARREQKMAKPEVVPRREQKMAKPEVVPTPAKPEDVIVVLVALILFFLLSQAGKAIGLID